MDRCVREELYEISSSSLECQLQEGCSNHAPICTEDLHILA
jgi:hypothetical protein